MLYREWFPQMLYNHHQSGPAGTVLWSPPLRDPFNYNQDPLLVLGIQTIGIALHTRLAAEGKPGATMRSGGPYDGWWNGGIRNTAAFHNTIAILTEMIGSPTPMRVPLVLDRQIADERSRRIPVPPQEWHFRQSIDYSVACNLGVLDIASKMKENFLYNRYVMGKNSIERGQPDTWTPAPHRYEPIADSVAGGGAAAAAAAGSPAAAAGRGRGGRGGGGNDSARCGRRCTGPRIAIRAATSCRRLSPTSRRRRSSSTRCSRPASACSARRASSRCRARRIRPARSSC